jgi:hypothetical protein
MDEIIRWISVGWASGMGTAAILVIIMGEYYKRCDKK